LFGVMLRTRIKYTNLQKSITQKVFYVG